MVRISYTIAAIVFAITFMFGLAVTPSFYFQEVDAQGIRKPKSMSGLGPIVSHPVYGDVIQGSYVVVMDNQSFTSVDNNATFRNNMEEIKPNNEHPELINKTLKTEYDEQIHEIIEEKAGIYNETLADQGGRTGEIMQYGLRGFAIQNVQDVSPFVGDPDILAVSPNKVAYPQTEYLSRGLDRIDSDKVTNPLYKIDATEQVLNVDVAVIDSRIYANHPDLNVVQSICIISTNCNVGYHGTHVAGIVAARDNLGGLVGVAPGARIHSIAVCQIPDPTTFVSTACTNIASAFNWVTSNAATIEVATMSLGCGMQRGSTNDCLVDTATETALNNAKAAGVTITVSAGNDQRTANNLAFCYPAAVICVSAMADTDGKCGSKGPSFTFYSNEGIVRDDIRAPFSNFGSAVDIMAPGYEIPSTYPPGITAADDVLRGSILEKYPYIGIGLYGSYGAISGTSMAAPHVAGAALLIKLKNPTLNADGVRSAILANSYPQTQVCDDSSKGGLFAGANSRSSEPILWIPPT